MVNLSTTGNLRAGHHDDGQFRSTDTNAGNRVDNTPNISSAMFCTAVVVQNMVDEMLGVLSTMKKFNTKENSEQASKDLTDMLRFFVAEDDKLNPFLDKCIQAGNVLFTLGMHVKEGISAIPWKMVETLIQN